MAIRGSDCRVNCRKPITLLTQMEAELMKIRRLAGLSERRYKTTVERLHYLEDTLLEMFKMRLKLMENMILDPQFVAASQKVISASTTVGSFTDVNKLQELSENLHFLKNQMGILQRQMNVLTGGSNSERIDAESIRQELEKYCSKSVEEGSCGLSVRRTLDNGVVEKTANYLPLLKYAPALKRTDQCTRVQNKRTKFTC